MSSMNKQRGFSMLEVLISMLVIMIGALGIAGMQLLAITSTENARYQNVATMLGASLTANMQANVAYWGTPPETIEIIGASNTGGPAAFTGSCKGLTSACNATEMAGYDLTAWGQEVAALLPAGKAEINCPQNNNPAICTVKLTWLERNVALQDTPAEDNDDDSGGEDEDDDDDDDDDSAEEVESALKSGTRQQNTYETLVSIL